VFAEFSVIENLMFYEHRTDRWKGTLLSTEVNLAHPEAVYAYLKERIQNGKDSERALIAKHLPKRVTGQYRRAIKEIKARKGAKAGEEFKWTFPEQNVEWIKHNGILLTPEEMKVGYLMVKDGDKLSYPRKKSEAVLKAQSIINRWIADFCSFMSWDSVAYAEFRKLQNTAEQRFSSGSILSLSENEFYSFLDALPGGARLRVARMVTNKVGEKFVPNPEWKDLGVWYQAWEANQDKIAATVRTTMATGTKEEVKKVAKDLKIKATGQTTLSLLMSLLQNLHNADEVDRLHTAMMAKMPMEISVFPIVDTSSSMNSSQIPNVSNKDIALALTVNFSIYNAKQEWRGQYGEFAGDFRLLGQSEYIDDRPNVHVVRSPKQGTGKKIFDLEGKFSQNLHSARINASGRVAGTNMMSAVEFFVDLVTSGKFHVEQLPNCLMWITDNENNSGKTPTEAERLAHSIGWYPLFVFWGIKEVPMSIRSYADKMTNALFIGGFNEGALSQILSNITKNRISPEDELWAIYDDVRYSVITN
jgi:hypothetical protein